MVSCVWSGGQFGADLAGTKAAIALDIPYCGYLTKNRRAEKDQIVDPKYDKFIELDTFDYPTRTEANIKGSDATLLITVQGNARSPLSGGSLLTKNLALKHNKPLLWINTDIMFGVNSAAEQIRNWLKERPEIKILNVAGSRGSKALNFEELCYSILIKALGSDDSSESLHN